MFARGFLLLAATSAVLGARVLGGAKINPNHYAYVSPIKQEHHARTLEFTIYLPASDDAGLDKRMAEIALNRDLPWLTEEELGSYVAPHPHHVDAVAKHLETTGIPAGDLTWSPHKDQVRVELPAKQFQTLFPGSELHIYRYNGLTETLKTPALHIPDHLSEAVAHVSHLADFPVTRRTAVSAPSSLVHEFTERHETQEASAAVTARSARSLHAGSLKLGNKHAKRFSHRRAGAGGVHADPIHAPIALDPNHSAPSPHSASGDVPAYKGDLTDCGEELVTASCVRHYYGTYDYTQKLKDDNATAPDTTIFGYIGQNADQADLTSYLKKYRPEAAGYEIEIEDILGAQTNRSAPSSEPQIDIQLAVGQSWPLQTKYVNLGAEDDPNDIYLQSFDWLLYHGGRGQRPGVISISYDSQEDGMTVSGAHTMCHAAKKLSALGTTIAVSTGDYGVTGFGSQSHDWCAADGTGKHPFIPLYPVGCPYILAVGSNQGFDGIGLGESMVNITYTRGRESGYYSGAGRSNIFPIPEYQRKDVEELNRRLEHSPTEPPYMYNHTGRLYPDTVAYGLWYAIIVDGEVNGLGGTSAATPTTAANLALVNDALVRAGKSRLGWVHPLLYSHKAREAAFHDVWSGGSFGCEPITIPNHYGEEFVGAKARTGYDSASGLGSWRFKPLLKILGL